MSEEPDWTDCDNTIHWDVAIEIQDVQRVLMRYDLCDSGEKEYVDWCEECRDRDKDCITTEEEWEEDKKNDRQR